MILKKTAKSIKAKKMKKINKINWPNLRKYMRPKMLNNSTKKQFMFFTNAKKNTRNTELMV